MSKTIGTKQVPEDVLAVLRNVECDGNSLRITENLARSMYLKVIEVIGACGGKWDRKAKAILFDSDVSAEDVIIELISTGEYTNTKKLFQEFFTPDDLAKEMCGTIEHQDFCLEPSAGRGAIAKYLHKARRLVCVEIQPKHCAELREAGFDPVIETDFLQWEEPKYEEEFTRIVMNPPFTRLQDIKHVRHAFDYYLKPGGYLTAITSPGWTFRNTKLCDEFRDFVESYSLDTVELPAGTFKESGTLVQTMLIRLRKPLST